MEFHTEVNNIHMENSVSVLQITVWFLFYDKKWVTFS